MKRIATVISVVTATMLFSALAIFGADNYSAPFRSYGGRDIQSNQKNECLLVAKNCSTESNTLQQRLIELRNEIAKGLKVYTPTELNMLKEQLKWIANESKDTTS